MVLEQLTAVIDTNTKRLHSSASKTALTLNGRKWDLRICSFLDKVLRELNSCHARKDMRGKNIGKLITVFVQGKLPDTLNSVKREEQNRNKIEMRSYQQARCSDVQQGLRLFSSSKTSELPSEVFKGLFQDARPMSQPATWGFDPGFLVTMWAHLYCAAYLPSREERPSMLVKHLICV